MDTRPVDEELMALVKRAWEEGITVSVTQHSLPPYAMGHYYTRITTRPAHERPCPNLHSMCQGSIPRLHEIQSCLWFQHIWPESAFSHTLCRPFSVAIRSLASSESLQRNQFFFVPVLSIPTSSFP